MVLLSVPQVEAAAVNGQEVTEQVEMVVVVIEEVAVMAQQIRAAAEAAAAPEQLADQG